jgi:hypothetical protein
MQSFKVGAPDAEFLEKEYSPVLSQEDIVGIANYKAYIKLNIDNATTRAFSMNMIYTHDNQNLRIVPILKEYSAKKYGRKREFVDAEIEARLGISTDDSDFAGMYGMKFKHRKLMGGYRKHKADLMNANWDANQWYVGYSFDF